MAHMHAAQFFAPHAVRLAFVESAYAMPILLRSLMRIPMGRLKPMKSLPEVVPFPDRLRREVELLKVHVA